MEKELDNKTQGSGTNQRTFVAPQIRTVLMKMAKNGRKTKKSHFY